MSKTVRRWVLVDLYDIAEIESWLSDLSAHGLSLVKFGFFFAHFQKAEPAEMVYRLEPVSRPDEKPDDDMLGFYRERGWEYVATFNRLFYVFRAPPNTPEIHSEIVTQGYAFERLNQKLKESTAIVAILFTLIAAMILGIYLFSDWGVLEMVSGPGILNQILLILIELAVVLQTLRGYRVIHRLMKRLKAGLPMEHDRDYRKGRRNHTVAMVALMALAAVSVLCSVLNITERWDAPLSDVTISLPILPLDVVEQDPSFEYHSELFGGKDLDNRVQHEWNALAPVQYQIEQRGIVPGQEWSDHSGTYSPSMQIQYFRLSIPVLADSLLDDLIYRYTVHYYYDNEFETSVLSEPGLDRVELFSGQDRQLLFARSGNQVIMLRYYGKESLEGHLADLSAILAGWAE